jgi:hypothetical protein
MLEPPRVVHTRAHTETDMWTRDPTGQSQGEGERRRRPQLAGGEVSDQAKRTGVTLPTRELNGARGVT